MNEQLLWTLPQGIEMARRLELIAIEHNAHVALGGSVLHRDRESVKGLEVIIYPHESEKYFSPLAIIHAFVEQFACLEYHPEDEKSIYTLKVAGKRVDLFFLQ